MTRPLRLEYPGALYHVTSRGDRKEAIYVDDHDRTAWLETLALVCTRFNFVVHGYCQMTNHFHLVVETVEGNLSQGMRQLNGLYSRYFNRRYKLVGHLFQARYKAILVQKESYLLELSRYVLLNPLRANVVSSLDDWPWSSYRHFKGAVAAPVWLDVDWLLSQFGSQRRKALEGFDRFLMDGLGCQNPLAKISHALILGDDEFVKIHQQPVSPMMLREVSRPQRRVLSLSLPEYETRFPSREEAMAKAYLSTAFTMAKIAEHFGVSYKTVSRAVARYEAGAT